MIAARAPRRPVGRRTGVGAALLVVLVAACGPGTVGDQPSHSRTGGVVVIALDAEPVSLNPLVAADVSSVRAYAPMFPNLYQVDAHEVVSPDLASDFPTVSADGLQWTVPLRSGALWTDGKPISAADVVYTVQTEANPGLDTRATFDWSNLASVQRLDQATVRFTLRSADAAFLADQLVMPIVPEHVLGSVDVRKMSEAIYGSTPTVTGGPFKFSRRAEGQGIDLRANPGYYGGRAVVDTLREVIVRDPISAADALANAQLTWDQGLTGAAANRVRGTVGVRVQGYPDLGYHDLRFNTRAGHPFGDVASRQAVALAIDRDAFVRAVTGGTGVTLWGDISPTSWAYEPSALVKYREDPSRSRTLLREAGWAPGPDGILARDAMRFSIPLYYAIGDPRLADAARRLASAMRRVGIEVKPRELTRFEIQERLLKGDFELALASSGLGLDPDEYDVLHAPGAAESPSPAYGGTGYSDPLLGALLERERGIHLDSYVATRAARKQVFSDIQRHLGTNLPSLYLWADTRFHGVNTTLGGLDEIGNHADQDRNSRLYAGLFLRS